MTTETKRITYDEFVEVVCILAVRLERLENLLADFFEAYCEQNEFLTKEVLKTEMERLRHQKKDSIAKRFINNRITETENSLKGFITHHETKGQKDEPF